MNEANVLIKRKELEALKSAAKCLQPTMSELSRSASNAKVESWLAINDLLDRAERALGPAPDSEMSRATTMRIRRVTPQACGCPPELHYQGCAAV